MLWLFCHILKHYGRANFDPFLKRRARIVRKAFYAWTLQHSWLVTQHLRIQDKMRSNEAVCTGLLYQYQSWKQSSCLELVLCILCRRFHFVFLSLLCALFQIVNISKYFGGLGKRFAAQIFRWNLPNASRWYRTYPSSFAFVTPFSVIWSKIPTGSEPKQRMLLCRVQHNYRTVPQILKPYFYSKWQYFNHTFRGLLQVARLCFLHAVQ